MSGWGQTQSFGHVGPMSGLPKSGHDWAMSTRPSLTPLADLGRSARQAPLHRLHAAGIAAAGDDAEVAAGLPECLLIDVGLGGRLLDDARRLGATCELLPEEALRTLAGRRRVRCFTRPLARRLTGFLGELLAGDHGGGAADPCGLFGLRRRGGGGGPLRGPPAVPGPRGGGAPFSSAPSSPGGPPPSP